MSDRCTHLWVGREKVNRDDPPSDAPTIWRCQACRAEFDLEPERAVVSRDALRDALYRDPALGPGYMLREDCEHIANRVLASGALQDPADVRAELVDEIEELLLQHSINVDIRLLMGIAHEARRKP